MLPELTRAWENLCFSFILLCGTLGTGPLVFSLAGVTQAKIARQLIGFIYWTSIQGILYLDIFYVVFYILIYFTY